MTEEAKTGGKNVIIAMDGSEHSKFAFKWFVDNCRKEDDHVYIVHAVETNEMFSSKQFSSPYSFDPDVLASILKKQKERVTKELQQYAALLTESGVNGTVQSVHTTNPGEGIVKCAAELDAAIIVTGTRGLGKIRRTLIGSTSFSDYLLGRIAEDLLDDWIPVLMKLGLKYTYVKRIEKAYPDNLYRQALEGLSQWRKSIARTEVGMTDAYNYLEIAFEEKGRQDLIDLKSKLKDNNRNDE